MKKIYVYLPLGFLIFFAFCFFAFGTLPLTAASSSACPETASAHVCYASAAASEVSLLIWTFGDSNAAKDDGWAVQLQELMPDSYIHNTSRSGRTIGFDNLDNPELNGLKAVGKSIESTMKLFGGKKPDVIVVGLGTNDTKACFADMQAGGNERIAALVPQLSQIAVQCAWVVVDIYHSLADVFTDYSVDGVHMNAEGQKLVAEQIRTAILSR